MTDHAHEPRVACRASCPAMRAISASCSSRRRSAAGCSRISSTKRVPGSRGSAGDTRLASDDGLDDLERVVEDDDVGRAARDEPPDVGRPSTRAGTVLAASSACSSGTPTSTRFRTACGIVRALPASTPSSRRTTSSATTISVSPSAYVPSPSPAPAIASVTSAIRPPAGRQRRRTMSGSRWTPSTIAWTTTSGRTSAAPTIPGSRWASGRIALKTWVTVRTPRSNAAFASAAVAFAVPERDGDAARVEQVDQLERAGQLGRERHQPHGTCREQALEQRDIGIAPRGEAVRAEAGGGEERPLEVGAEDPRAVIPVRDRAQRADHVLLGRGDERRQVRRDAGLEERLAGGGEAVRVRAEEVDARRTRSPGGRRSREPRCRDTPGSSPTAEMTPPSSATSPGSEPSVDERSLDAEPHRSSASRTTPPAASSRARAAAASMPATSATIATFASPSASASAASTRSSDAPVALRDDPADARAQLVVRRDDVDHEVAVRLARAGPSRWSRSC